MKSAAGGGAEGFKLSSNEFSVHHHDSGVGDLLRLSLVTGVSSGLDAIPGPTADAIDSSAEPDDIPIEAADAAELDPVPNRRADPIDLALERLNDISLFLGGFEKLLADMRAQIAETRAQLGAGGDR